MTPSLCMVEWSTEEMEKTDRQIGWKKKRRKKRRKKKKRKTRRERLGVSYGPIQYPLHEIEIAYSLLFIQSSYSDNILYPIHMHFTGAVYLNLAYINMLCGCVVQFKQFRIFFYSVLTTTYTVQAFEHLFERSNLKSSTNLFFKHFKKWCSFFKFKRVSRVILI